MKAQPKSRGRAWVGRAFIVLAAIGPVWPVSPALQAAVWLFTDTLDRRMAGAVFVCAYVVALVALAQRLIDGQSWDRLFGKEALPNVLVGLGLGAASALSLVFAGFLSGGGLSALSLSLSELATLLSIAVVLALAAALVEETLLRGVAQTWLAKTLPVVAVAALQGLTFAALHAPSYSSALLASWFFVNGFALSIAAFAYRTLWVAITWHCCWNFANTVLSTGVDSGEARIGGLLDFNWASPATALPMLTSMAAAAFLASRPSVQRLIATRRSAREEKTPSSP